MVALVGSVSVSRARFLAAPGCGYGASCADNADTLPTVTEPGRYSKGFPPSPHRSGAVGSPFTIREVHA